MDFNQLTSGLNPKMCNGLVETADRSSVVLAWHPISFRARMQPRGTALRYSPVWLGGHKTWTGFISFGSVPQQL